MLKGVSQSFRDRADPAAFWEAWVGAVLARAGLYTMHFPFQIDGKDHSQSWDLWVNSDPFFGGCGEGCYKSDGERPVEIKARSLRFTSRYDFPFDDVLVCSQASWLRKWPGKDTVQRDFMMVSTITGAIVWLPTGSPVTLGQEVLDKSRPGEDPRKVTTKKHNLDDLYGFIEKVKTNSY